MPRSGYQRDEDGPELERYDDRFGDGGKDCEIDYLVPIVRRAPAKS
jgi:predicted transcriptional regulator YdeE